MRRRIGLQNLAMTETFMDGNLRNMVPLGESLDADELVEKVVQGGV